MNNPNDRDISLSILSPQSRVTAVVIQTVPPERADEFPEWQRGVTREASHFPGYKYTDCHAFIYRVSFVLASADKSHRFGGHNWRSSRDPGLVLTSPV